jgi:hypothetical protein
VKLEVEPSDGTHCWSRAARTRTTFGASSRAAATAVGEPVFLHSGGTGGAVVFPCIRRGKAARCEPFLLYSAACFGQEREFEQLHLGGVAGGGGSLLEFKQRFSPGPLREQWFGKAVHDVNRYLELAQVESVSYAGFFPAYRRL